LETAFWSAEELVCVDPVQPALTAPPDGAEEDDVVGRAAGRGTTETVESR